MNTWRWYVVHTAPRAELRCARQLEMQGFRAFLPLYWKTVRHARQFRTVKAPFFPRYLFVQLDVGRQRWRSVNGTFGVSSLLMEGDRPKPVPVGVVEALESGADPDGLLGLSAGMQPGGKVRVLTGPFADRIGELVQVDERNRVKVLLDVLGGRLSVSLDRMALAPAA